MIVAAIRVLHVTAHLGGGVGRALTGLFRASSGHAGEVRHTVVCLETPKNRQFSDRLADLGVELVVSPSAAEFRRRMLESDIVQVEWWHHPELARWMCFEEWPAIRLIIWSHVSGLHPPIIPPAFLQAPHRFLFTSPCSWEHPDLAPLRERMGGRVETVFSASGLDEMPSPPQRGGGGSLRFGYVGTLNPAKCHPRILDFIAAVKNPAIKLIMVGDLSGGESLLAEARARGLEDSLELRGYRTDIPSELAGFDVFCYLLNPLHYGTTENALLEAMAMGVVPIVMDNPAERHLVAHGETGLVVSDVADFQRAVDWLGANPAGVRRLSENASSHVRGFFTATRIREALLRHYRSVLTEERRVYDFREIFGATPAEWFMACQGEDAWRFSEPSPWPSPGPDYLFESTKSSVFHFADVFPEDQQLAKWAENLKKAAPWNR